jgi:hypothetical protein
MRTFAALGVLLVVTGGSAAAQNPQHCSREAFPVNGHPVTVTVCAGTVQGRSLPVTEAFSRGSQSFNRTATIDVLPGAEVSRAIDDASLTPFGLPYTLHLTLAYRGGSGVGIEHALLLPGAVPLK